MSWTGVFRSATWGTVNDRNAMGHAAHYLVEWTGLAECVVRVPRADGLCEVVVAIGARAGGARVGSAVPLGDFAEALSCGARYGALVFVAEEWRGGTSADGPLPMGDGSDAWRPGDLLVADVRDDDGALRALVQFDRPRDGLRPSPHRLVQLSEELHLPLGAVLTVVERELAASHARVSREIRTLVRDLDRRTSMEELLTLVKKQMKDAFRASKLYLHLPGDAENPAVGELPISPDLHRGFAHCVRRAWEQGGVLIAEGGHLWGDPEFSAQHGAELGEVLGRFGFTSLTVVPVGAEGRTLGVLCVARTPPGPALDRQRVPRGRRGRQGPGPGRAERPRVCT